MSRVSGPLTALDGSAEGVYTEPARRRIRVVVAGETIVDTMSASLVWEHAYYPQYYFPESDVAPGILAS